MLDIFYFSKLKNTRVHRFPGWTSWQQWTVGSSRTAPVAKPSGYLHFLVVSFLSVEYFRSVAKPPINLLWWNSERRKLFGTMSFSYAFWVRTSHIQCAQHQWILFVKGSDIVGLVQFLSFCISNKLVREADHFMNGKVLVHIPWGTVYEIASLWSQRQRISSHS